MAHATSQLSEEQHRLRSTGVGASEFAAVMGVDPNSNPLKVWLDKTNRNERFEGNEFTRWGNRLEKEIAAEYAERMNVKVVRCGTLVHPKYPWVLATPDRRVYTKEGPKRKWGLECKNRNYFNYKAWGTPGTDEAPVEVVAQCQICMEVTNLARWDIAVLLGGNRLGIYTIHRDQALINDMIETVHEFWHEYVLADVQPPLDGSAISKDWMDRKWRLHGPDMMEATPEIVELAADHRVVKIALTANEASEKRLKYQLQDLIGTRLGVDLPDGGKITWRMPKAAEVVNWEAIARGAINELKLDAETVETLIGVHTSEKKVTRRFLPQYGSP